MNLFTSEYFKDWSITECSVKYTFDRWQIRNRWQALLNKDLDILLADYGLVCKMHIKQVPNQK